MNLVVKADWPISTSDLAEANAVIRTTFSEMLPLATLALDLSGEPWDDYTGTLEVMLHSSSFQSSYWPENTSFHSGLTHWFPPNGDSRIEIAWNVQHQEGQNPLRHEWCHWFGLQAGREDWGECAHGTENDPFMKVVKRDMDLLYGANFKVTNGRIEFPGYKEIDFSKPEWKGYKVDFRMIVLNGELVCEAFKGGAILDFTADELKKWLWHLTARGGKLRPRSFDKET